MLEWEEFVECCAGGGAVHLSCSYRRRGEVIEFSRGVMLVRLQVQRDEEPLCVFLDAWWRDSDLEKLVRLYAGRN